PLRRDIEQRLQEGRHRRAQFEAAERAYKERHSEIESLRAEITQLPTIEVSHSLQAAIKAVRAAGDIDAQLNVARNHLAREEQALRRRLSTLAQPGVEVPPNIDDAMAWLNQMMPWSTASVAEETQRRQQLRSHLDTHAKQLAESES